MKNINNKEFSFISEIDNRKLTNVLYNGELVLDFQEEVKKEMFQLFSDKYIYIRLLKILTSYTLTLVKIPPILENIKIFSGSQVQKESFIQYVTEYRI